ncbi:MAG TPA: hypothetical protein VMZ28_04440, partial [Kofleriaceae bacterium]|nr:hypothetical protein [Kofleriaceae bacterium]
MPADFVQRGQKLCAEAQFQEAVKVCRLGLLAHPTEIDGRLVLGAALMALSRHDEVLAEMRVALELDNDNPRALALKGEALLRKGDALQAHDVLARAVSAAPSDTGIRNLYGEARRIREGGVDAPPPLAPPPRAGPTSGAWVAMATPGAGAAKGDRSGTIEIDPDIEGVEVESSASRTGTLDLPTEVAEESDAGIELQTGDLIRESYESGAAFDSTDGPFQPRSSPSQRALPPVEAAVDQPARGGNWQVPVSGPSDRTRALQGPAPMPSASMAAPPPLDQMFPEDEEGVSGIEIVGPRGGAPFGHGERGRTDDMRMIRQGLGLSPEGSSPGRLPPRRPDEMGAPRYPGPGPQPPQPQRRDPRGRGQPAARPRAGRRGVPLLVYALLALLVLGGAVLTGIKVRDMRLSGQVQAASASADAATALDTYAGYVHALEAHGRIVKAQDTAAHRAARAVVAARMAASLGEGVDPARAMVTELGDARSPDAVLARGLLAVTDGDVETARGAATDLAAAVPASPDALYLRGRVGLLEQKPAEAAEALRAAVQAQPQAMALVALALAEGLLGRTAEALAALDRAAQVSPGHAGAAIARARIQVRARQLPALPEPETTLEALIADGKLPPAQQKMSVSPGQAAWAALALAEVKVQRGDIAGAKAAMAVAQAQAAPRDLQFRPAMASMLMELGEAAAARAQVELALSERPASAGVRLLEAQVALDGGDPNAALAALAALGDLSHNAEALALRGRVRLALGSVEPAGGDLDAALL